MELGLNLAQDGLEYEEIKNIAVESERIGLDSIWLFDHLNANPQPDKEQFLECWTLLSALAIETKHIRLGPLVININSRNPALLAKMAATLDHISSGRLEFGVGAGGTNRAEQQRQNGYSYELDAYGIPFPMKPSIRIDKLDEGVEIIKRMWTQNSATFNGVYYSIKDAICLPKLIQKPYPKIWIGGGLGQKMVGVVAKYADGWNMQGVSDIENFKKGKELLSESCRRIDRNPNEIETSIIISDSINGCENKLRQFAAEGLNLAILRPPRGKEVEYMNNKACTPKL